MSASTSVGTRFKTGQQSPSRARYEFDGYVDGTNWPSPTAEERCIELERGETFPPIKSAEKACWWKLTRHL
ncbi:MAG: YjzC family protein [Planctomycetota bacterium]|nr:MAG: YjzC family protein [Planctomycetota bacterium]REJ95697.1 MAG: YjzC family protein [Planctomycetota bacterium]REK22929.1 MAG: YjzC family protein [Planctomycetota bacterium]REK27783.1 MAG: YjzC family protein [Planctomycetota bacterium]